MAPEQALGQRAERTSDVYALGAILYELLTGRAPFRAASMKETLEQVIRDDPVPVGTMQPKCPRDLETICLKCLQKDPKRRYRTARKLAEDLKNFLEKKPIRARPVSSLERVWKWAQRQPGVAGCGAASCCWG
jgi:serine/threonine protein kinase